jgi:hypothetical protein
MKKIFDLKSGVIGLVAGAAIVLLLGAAGTSTESRGRYQAVMGDGGVAIVVDTTTGQVWRHSRVGSLNDDANFFKAKTQL